MAGTKEGSRKAVATILATKPNHFREIGTIGGASSKTGGFASNVRGADGLTGKERARIAGSKGGVTSRRSVAKYHMFKGKMRSVQYISEYLGVTRGAIYARLERHGNVYGADKKEK